MRHELLQQERQQVCDLRHLLEGKTALLPVLAAESAVVLAEVAPEAADLRENEMRREELARQRAREGADRRKEARERQPGRQVFTCE